MTGPPEPAETHVILDPATGETIPIGARRGTIRRADTFRSWGRITGFDPPSTKHPMGRIRYSLPDGGEAAANPSFFEAAIVEADPAAIRSAVETHEWRSFWSVLE